MLFWKKIILFLFTDCGFPKYDLVFGIPMAGNISEKDFDHMKQFISQMIIRANIDGGGTQVGLFVFDTDVRAAFVTELNSTTTRKEVLDKVSALPYIASTQPASLTKALEQFEVMFTMQDNNTRYSVPDLALLFLTPDVAMGTALEKAKELRQANIHVYVTAVGFQNETLPQQIAYHHDNYVHPVDSFLTLLFLAPFKYAADRCSEFLYLFAACWQVFSYILSKIPGAECENRHSVDYSSVFFLFFFLK